MLNTRTNTITANRPTTTKRRRNYHHDNVRSRNNGHYVYYLYRYNLQRRLMRCPKCHTKTEVLDSRTSDLRVRRRRQCPACKRKLTTQELTDKDWFEYLTEALRKVLKVPTDD